MQNVLHKTFSPSLQFGYDSKETETQQLLRRQEILPVNQLLHTVPYGQNGDHTVVTLFDFMTLLLRPPITVIIIGAEELLECQKTTLQYYLTFPNRDLLKMGAW